MAKLFDKEAWLARKEEKLSEAKVALEEGLNRLQTSEGWQEMLKAMAHLGRLSVGRLSFNNQVLVQSQRPGTVNAATFQAWKENSRSVKKGEKGMAILAPVFAKKDKENSEVDDAMKLVGFRVLTVFSEEQTEGKPLPKYQAPDVEGAEAFEGSVEKLREVALAIPGAPVTGIELRLRVEGDVPNARGWYQPATKHIVVLTDGRTRAQQFSTLCHEVAHALLHPIGDPHGRAAQEVEAESTAFVVCHALGLDTGAKSFPYVGGWGEGEGALKLISESGQRIAKAARRVLDALCGEAAEEQQTGDGVAV